MTSTSQKLTRALAERIQPEAKDVIIRDTETPGLFLRVTPNGTKSLGVRFRLGYGRAAPVKQPRIPVDPFEVGGIEKARRIAREWKAAGAEGRDPAAERRAAAAVPTMKELLDRYMLEHGSRKKSADADKRRIARLPVSFTRRRLPDVGFSEVSTLHRSMSDTPIEANRVAALLSKAFSLAVRWGLVTANPVTGLERFPENKRERYLTTEELARLADACDAYARRRGDNDALDAVAAIELLLLTGCRSGELLAADWSQFDEGAAVWTKPSSHTKTAKVHRVHLNAGALETLHALRDRNGHRHWIFPGVRGGHRKSIRAAWLEISTDAGLSDVHVHDLRHTAASLMLSGGVSLDIVGRVLGHTQANTTLRYAHLTEDASKAAVDALSGVVNLKRRGDSA